MSEKRFRCLCLLLCFSQKSLHLPIPIHLRTTGTPSMKPARPQTKRINVQNARYTINIRMNQQTRTRFNAIADDHESRTGSTLSDGKILEVILDELFSRSSTGH